MTLPWVIDYKTKSTDWTPYYNYGPTSNDPDETSQVHWFARKLKKEMPEFDWRIRRLAIPEQTWAVD